MPGTARHADRRPTPLVRGDQRGTADAGGEHRPAAGPVPDGWNDEQLLTALGEALRAREAVPARFLETARNAYAWHNIDAELAQLTYDSSRDQALASVRSETASIRALTFTSAHFSMDLEVSDDCLLGQIMPPAAGAVEVQA